MSDILMNTGMKSVTNALAELTVDQAFLAKLTTKELRNQWESFGKMNSHVYRKMLTDLYEASKLTKEAIFMIHFLFSVVKNVNRVLTAMDSLPQTMRDELWFNPVKEFLQGNVVQYVSDVQKTKKFPAVNIPHTNPALDILGYVLSKEQTSLWDLYERTTSVQLHLSNAAQSAAREGYLRYWTNVVTRTNNSDSGAFSAMTPEKKEEFYANPAADRYLLVARNFEEIIPISDSVGYGEEELAVYLLIEGEPEFLVQGKKLPSLASLGDAFRVKFPSPVKLRLLNENRDIFNLAAIT